MSSTIASAGASGAPVLANRLCVFVGSSSEGQGIAEHIQVLLDKQCDVTIWDQGVFGLSSGTLESLVAKAPTFDFAILVLTPDDLTLSRDQLHASPRDNVLFEIGLFMGVLGRERTFIVYDSTVGIKLPSDLAGVCLAPYRPHHDGNLLASLGVPCTLIKVAMNQLRGRPGSTLPSRVISEVEKLVAGGIAEVKKLVAEGTDSLEELRRIGFRSRYAGPFPHCFDDICAILKDAQKSIHIVCDFPCYGYFSRRETYDAYVQTLKDKAAHRGVRVEIVVPDLENRKRLQEIQFGKTDDDWHELKNDPNFRELLNGLSRGEGHSIESMAEFHRSLLAVQRHVLQDRDLMRGIKQVPAIPALHAWIVDQERAVFTIPLFGRNAHEQGFWTSEGDVITSLVSIWRYYEQFDPSLGATRIRGGGMTKKKQKAPRVNMRRKRS